MPVSIATPFLRPPGVLSEKEFTSRCTSCGQCVAVCTFHCIEMTADFFFWGQETPKIFQRKSPCFLCMKCVEVCPTEALHKVPIEKSAMGTAVISSKHCVDYQNDNMVMCWTCYERCPLKAKAIVLQGGYVPAITLECVGCGVCEYVCPVKAITTIPTRYRMGAGV